MDYRWYVAQALAGLESTAIYHLSREGITAFSPRLIADDGRSVRLFPTYVFVELEGPHEAGRVNRQRGVHKLLPIRGKARAGDDPPVPLPLPVDFVEGLRERIARKDFREGGFQESVMKFVPQEEVFIRNGPFRDFRGRFLRYSKGSAVVLTYLLGREHELKIPTRDISAASLAAA